MGSYTLLCTTFDAKDIFGVITLTNFGTSINIGGTRLYGSGIAVNGSYSSIGSGSIKWKAGTYDIEIYDMSNVSGSSGGGVFVDVNALPETTDPNVIYRVNKPEVYTYSGGVLYTLHEAFLALLGAQTSQIKLTTNIISVDELPSEPVPITTSSSSTEMVVTVYVYNNSIYGWYGSTEDPNAVFVWISDNEIVQSFNMAGYGGVTNTLDTTNLQDGYVYLYYNLEYTNVTEKGTFTFASKDEADSTESLSYKLYADNPSITLPVDEMIALIDDKNSFIRYVINTLGNDADGNPIEEYVDCKQVSNHDFSNSTYAIIGDTAHYIGFLSKNEMVVIEADRTWNDPDTDDMPDDGNTCILSAKVINFNNLGGSSSGSANVFEDVTELPESPDSSKIYRVKNPIIYMYTGGELVDYSSIFATQGGKLTIICVDELPSSPIPMIDVTTGSYVFYVYNDNVASYVDEEISQYLSLPVGWLENNNLTQVSGLTYGGLIDSLDTTNLQDDYIYLYYQTPTYINTKDNNRFIFSSENYANSQSKYKLLAYSNGEFTETKGSLSPDTNWTKNYLKIECDGWIYVQSPKEFTDFQVRLYYTSIPEEIGIINISQIGCTSVNSYFIVEGTSIYNRGSTSNGIRDAMCTFLLDYVVQGSSVFQLIITFLTLENTNLNIPTISKIEIYGR